MVALGFGRDGDGAEVGDGAVALRFGGGGDEAEDGDGAELGVVAGFDTIMASFWL